MKKYFIPSISIFFLLFFLTECKKSSVAVPKSNWVWSLSKSHFVGNSTTYEDLILRSEDEPYNPQVYLEIDFSSNPVSGSYAVVDHTPAGAPTPSSHIDFFSNNQLQFESSGGGTVNVTINNGKITATFSNIPMGVDVGSSTSLLSSMIFYTPDGTLSGQIIEQ